MQVQDGGLCGGIPALCGGGGSLWAGNVELRGGISALRVQDGRFSFESSLLSVDNPDVQVQDVVLRVAETVL